MTAGVAGGAIIDRQMPSPAVLNNKMWLIDTGANIAAFASPQVGMHAYCTATGSGFTINRRYVYNGTTWDDVTGWTLLGRTTLGGTADSISVSIATGYRYLRIKGHIIASGAVETLLRFNADSGNNYSWRESSSGAADTTLTSTSSIIMRTSITNGDYYFVADVVNVATRVKLLVGVTNGTLPGAANVPGKKEVTGQWANTTDSITAIASVNAQSGDYATGSELLVLGMV